MIPADQAYYRLAAGTDVVPLQDGDVLLRSDAVAVRLEGSSANLFGSTILPLLDGRRSLADVTEAVPNVEPDELRQHLDSLVTKGVLRRGRRDEGGDPLVNLLDLLGWDASDARQLLGTLRVAVFGLEAHGAHAATALAECGVNVVLVDPYPCQPGNLVLVPGLGPAAVGIPRHAALRSALEAQGRDTVTVPGGDEVDAAVVDAVAAGCDLMIGSFDKAFSAVNHWINTASLSRQVPAVYSELKGTSAFVGPLVVPEQTGCYLCWRMRALACEEDFEAAMSHEEFLDRQKRPALDERAVLPGLASYVGGMVVMEALKHLLGVGRQSFAGRVREFDALTGKTEVHTVVAVSDCPACSKKKLARDPSPASMT